MSVGKLKQAAALLRELAEAATPGPWTSWVEGRDGFGGDDVILTRAGDIYPTCSTADQDYIATMSPPLAQALVELLEHAAERSGNKIARGGGSDAVWSHERDALAIADLILGGVA